MCNMERIGHTASEDMASENVDGGRTISSFMSDGSGELIMTHFQMNAPFSYAFLC